jgi:hypothetical protein
MADHIIRHMFPGNNTSQGFFSYFAYILPQQQAKRRAAPARASPRF